MEFLKGYIFGKYYGCHEYILDACEGERESYVYNDGYSYPYWRVGNSWIDKYNNPEKRQIRTWVENGKPCCAFEDLMDFIDHHNFVFEDGACALGDTPQEAVRQYLLTCHDIDCEVYVRKNNRFIYVKDLANDKAKWDELFDGVTTIYIYTNKYPYTLDSEFEMASFDFSYLL